MGRRKYPTLTPAEVKAILVRWSFAEKNREGSHVQYEHLPDDKDDQRRIVTVDTGEKEFDDFLIKSMIRQSGLTREEFYGATKRTARRASVEAIQIQQSPEPETE
jgi:predicted RNA binding protein YcfA (HicA-like mRNA interferase family)